MKPIVTAHDAKAAYDALRRAGDVAKLSGAQLKDQKRLLEDVISSVSSGVAKGTIGDWAAFRLSGLLLGRLQAVESRIALVDKLEQLFVERVAPRLQPAAR